MCNTRKLFERLTLKQILKPCFIQTLLYPFRSKRVSICLKLSKCKSKKKKEALRHKLYCKIESKWMPMLTEYS